MMAFNISQIKQSIASGDHERNFKELRWIKLFGDKKLFQDSIMSPKPKIPNTWNVIQYLEYQNTYCILNLKSLDDWASASDVRDYYNKKLSAPGYASSSDSPDDDQLNMINYQEFCDDVSNLFMELKNDMNDYGVPELQSYIGAYTTMFFVLKKFRKEFYTSLYTFQDDEKNEAYQKSPLRHLLLFLIEKRLNRLIPHSDAFKFGSTYFQTFEYRKVAGDTIYEYLIEKYQSDMIACKFLA